MNTQIEALIIHLNTQYKNYLLKSKLSQEQIENLIKNHDFSFVEGKTYTKILSNSYRNKSAYCFIVNEDNQKFKKGDILKAASWNAPAKNKARGNIYNPASYNHFDWAGI